MPRAASCGSANTWSSVLIGPHGTPSGSSRSSHSRCRFVRTTSATIGSSVSRWRTRSAFFVNRGSAAHCGTPAASQNFAN